MSIFITIALIVGFFGIIGNQNIMLRKIDRLEGVLREISDELKRNNKA
ncbi:hypothetical protein M3231_08655 [Neobacillus mesonae]|nr:hypothetical protein [Neobacillus mesonae]